MESHHTVLMRANLIKAARKMQRINVSSLFQGMTQNEYFAIESIFAYMEKYDAEKGIYVSDLARLLHISASGVSRMLHMLEERDLVAREVNPVDRRNTYVYLTAAGIKARNEAYECWQILSDRVIEKIGEDKVEELIALWNTMSDVMAEEIVRMVGECRHDQGGKEKDGNKAYNN